MNGEGYETAVRARHHMVDVLSLDVDPGDIGENITLCSPRIQLDSLSMLQLLLAAEGEFGVELDDEDVKEADSRNVGGLRKLLRRSVLAKSTEGSS